MSSLLVVIVIGLIGGVAAGLQGPLAGIVGKHVGILGSIFIIHLGGTLVSGLLLLVPGAGGLAGWRNVPWYALAGGVLGLALIGALTFCIPRIGAAAAITLIIVSQLTIAACLDHFGLFVESVRSFDTTRVLGLVVLFFGTWLVVR
ncbi:MAG: DMT family transporter [Acidobacteriota bacterium]